MLGLNNGKVQGLPRSLPLPLSKFALKHLESLARKIMYKCKMFHSDLAVLDDPLAPVIARPFCVKLKLRGSKKTFLTVINAFFFH